VRRPHLKNSLSPRPHWTSPYYFTAFEIKSLTSHLVEFLRRFRKYRTSFIRIRHFEIGAVEHTFETTTKEHVYGDFAHLGNSIESSKGTFKYHMTLREGEEGLLNRQSIVIWGEGVLAKSSCNFYSG